MNQRRRTLGQGPKQQAAHQEHDVYAEEHRNANEDDRGHGAGPGVVVSRQQRRLYAGVPRQ
jgi:hypothetical protein